MDLERGRRKSGDRKERIGEGKIRKWDWEGDDERMEIGKEEKEVEYREGKRLEKNRIR